jgi:YVTN family beta-propeller protein
MPYRLLKCLLLSGCVAFSAGVIVACASATPAFAANQAAPTYRLTKTVSLGAGTRWDFVVFEPTSKRVYVAHGDHVTVVDDATAKAIGQIGPFPGGTHGIAIAPDAKVGYTDDGKAGTAIAFNPSTLKVLKHISAALDADAIIYEPVSRHVYVINGDSGSITVIDPKTDTAIADIKVGAGLEPGVPDGRGALFVNGVEKHEILKIDAKTNTVEDHWPMPGCRRPHGIAIDPQTRRLFVTCANKVMVIMNADSGTNMATLPIGGHSDGAAFDPVRKLIFSSNGEGTLTVIKEKGADTFTPLETIKTQVSARTMAIDPHTGRLFLAAATAAKSEPPSKPGGRPHATYVPGSLKLLYFDPSE